MTKKGYLTSCEYRAMRILLGFSQQGAADFHKLQNVRTIKRWEKGTSCISEIACDKITKLYLLINTQIESAISLAEQNISKSKDAEIVLIVYPDSCYKKFIFGIGDLPNSVHRAMVTRLYSELKKRNIVAGIVEFQPQDYFTFLAANGFKDSPESRSAWAVDYRKRLIN